LDGILFYSLSNVAVSKKESKGLFKALPFILKIWIKNLGGFYNAVTHLKKFPLHYHRNLTGNIILLESLSNICQEGIKKPVKPYKQGYYRFLKYSRRESKPFVLRCFIFLKNTLNTGVTAIFGFFQNIIKQHQITLIYIYVGKVWGKFYIWFL